MPRQNTKSQIGMPFIITNEWVKRAVNRVFPAVIWLRPSYSAHSHMAMIRPVEQED